MARPNLTPEKVAKIIAAALDEFYRPRIDKLGKLKLKDVLLRKNPYLFRAIGVTSAADIIQSILTAYTSSAEETSFGGVFFESIAFQVSGGEESASPGIDIIIYEPGVVRVYAIKSGTSIFNADGKKSQIKLFEKCKATLGTHASRRQFDPVIGYAYGRKTKPRTTTYHREIAGQELWEELTGDPDFYIKLMDLMKDKPAEHRIAYKKAYGALENRFVRDFTQEFCSEDGQINWRKLAEFNSGKERPPKDYMSRNGKGSKADA